MDNIKNTIFYLLALTIFGLQKIEASPLDSKGPELLPQQEKLRGLSLNAAEFVPCNKQDKQAEFPTLIPDSGVFLDSKTGQRESTEVSEGIPIASFMENATIIACATHNNLEKKISVDSFVVIKPNGNLAILLKPRTTNESAKTLQLAENLIMEQKGYGIIFNTSHEETINTENQSLNKTPIVLSKLYSTENNQKLVNIDPKEYQIYFFNVLAKILAIKTAKEGKEEYSIDDITLKDLLEQFPDIREYINNNHKKYKGFLIKFLNSVVDLQGNVIEFNRYNLGEAFRELEEKIKKLTETISNQDPQSSPGEGTIQASAADPNGPELGVQQQQEQTLTYAPEFFPARFEDQTLESDSFFKDIQKIYKGDYLNFINDLNKASEILYFGHVNPNPNFVHELDKNDNLITYIKNSKSIDQQAVFFIQSIETGKFYLVFRDLKTGKPHIADFNSYTKTLCNFRAFESNQKPEESTDPQITQKTEQAVVTKELRFPEMRDMELKEKILERFPQMRETIENIYRKISRFKFRGPRLDEKQKTGLINSLERYSNLQNDEFFIAFVFSVFSGLKFNRHKHLGIFMNLIIEGKLTIIDENVQKFLNDLTDFIEYKKIKANQYNLEGIDIPEATKPFDFSNFSQDNYQALYAYLIENSPYLFCEKEIIGCLFKSKRISAETLQIIIQKISEIHRPDTNIKKDLNENIVTSINYLKNLLQQEDEKNLLALVDKAMS